MTLEKEDWVCRLGCGEFETWARIPRCPVCGTVRCYPKEKKLEGE